jgi:hypothetical protein
MTNAISTVLSGHLQTAIDKIKDLGLTLVEPDAQPMTAILERVSDVGGGKAFVIARTLTTMQAFDALVSEKLRQVNYGDRFDKITDGFNTILEDARRQIAHEEEGRHSLSGFFGSMYAKVTRGDISQQFDEVKAVFKDVTDDAGKTIDTTRAILEAYTEARLALKEGQIAAIDLFDGMTVIHDAAKKALDDANAAVAAAPADMPSAERSKLELARDEKVAALRREDERLNIAKNAKEMLTVSYSVTETVFAKYNQFHQVLQSLYEKCVMFFSIQTPVVTALKGTLTGAAVVGELSRSQTAMEDGISKSLEAIADLGDQALREGVRVANSNGIRVSSVKTLVDSIVAFQQEQYKIAAEARAAATKDADEIAGMVEEGKRKVADFMTSAA